MQTQPSPQLLPLPATEDPSPRPDLAVVPTPRSRRLFGTFAIVTAAFVATGGYGHFCLYRHGYRTLPKSGVGFLLQVVPSAIVVRALLIGPHRVARLGRVAHLTDRSAVILTGLAAAALAAGTLVAFALTRTPGGLFNFQERGLQPAPQALIALVAESGVLLVLGAELLTAYLVRREPRAVAVARV